MKILLAWAVITAIWILMLNWEAWTDKHRARVKKKTDKHALDVVLFLFVPALAILAAVLYFGFAWKIGAWAALHLATSRYMLFNRIFNRKMNLHPFHLNPDVWWDRIEAENFFLRHTMTKMATFLVTSFFLIVNIADHYGQRETDQFGWIMAGIMLLGFGYIMATLLISPEKTLKERFAEKAKERAQNRRDQ